MEDAEEQKNVDPELLKDLIEPDRNFYIITGIRLIIQHKMLLMDVVINLLLIHLFIIKKNACKILRNGLSQRVKKCSNS